MRSGAVSYVSGKTEKYSGILAGTVGKKQSIVCDSKNGYAKPKIPGQFKDEGLIEVELPTKVGTYTSTAESKSFAIKIYIGEDKATSWEIKITKVTKSTISGFLKAEFDNPDKDQIEGDFSLEICTKG